MKKLRLLTPYLRRHKFKLLLCLVFAIIFDVSLVMLPLCNAKMIDEITRIIGTTLTLFDTEFFKYFIIYKQCF